MDNTNNNVVGDDQNTAMGQGINDISSTTPVVSNDYNSMQPPTPPQVGDLVSDLTGMPSAPASTAPVEEFPSVTTDNTTPVDMAQPASTPMDVPSFDTTSTVMGTPAINSTPMPTEPTPDVPSTTPMDTPAPVMEEVTPVAPVESPVPVMESISSPTPDTAPAFPSSPSIESPVAPVEAPIPDQSLNEPMPSFASETPITPVPDQKPVEVVNTLGEQTKDAPKSGKGGTAVVIVLIVIIVALLATIGYFAIKIFA